MSAIAGILHHDGRPVGSGELQLMAAALAHRGPDAAGIWLDGTAGLVHRLLWSTPESLHERLPAVSPTSSLALTADARIDNRAELISTLRLESHPHATLTDCTLILAAYERWGEQCVDHLLGDFAFAIWDGRRRRLFCARDHMGVKPLYYYASDRLFAFATEIKGILALPEVPRRPNELRIAEHLVGCIDDPELTFYEGIVRLPAAHTLVVEAKHLQIRRYWSLDPHRELRLRRDEEYVEAFRATFMEAVRCRLRRAFPIGSTLSGGLDSSSIACAARDLLRQQGGSPLHTFSAIFPGLPPSDLRLIDERPYIETVVAMGGIEPHHIRADQLSPLYDLDRMLWHGDGLVLAMNLYIHWGMFAAAQRRGVRVLLEGTDGDTTVGHGLDYLHDLALSGRWVRLWRESNLLSRNLEGRLSPRSIVKRYALMPLAKSWRSRFQIDRHRTLYPAFSVIEPAFARQTGLAERLRMLQPGTGARARSGRERHYQSLNSALIPGALEVMDWSAGAFALEPRYPFCDRRLVELCLALPADQRFRDGWTRAILRRAMAGVLPELVRVRPQKANLRSNFLRRLADCDHAVLEHAILAHAQDLRPYVDLTRLRAALRRYATNPMGTESDALAVYTSTMLWLGLRHLSAPNMASQSSSLERACALADPNPGGADMRNISSP